MFGWLHGDGADGCRRGRIGGFEYEVRLCRGPVSYGIDPSTLYKGYGRVARLVLYEPLNGSARRKVAAFDRGWQFGRKAYLPEIRRVVHGLERA